MVDDLSVRWTIVFNCFDDSGRGDPWGQLFRLNNYMLGDPSYNQLSKNKIGQMTMLSKSRSINSKTQTRRLLRSQKVWRIY